MGTGSLTPPPPDNLLRKEPFLLDIIITLSRNIAVLLGMGLVIILQLTFIVFVLWVSVMERFGILLSAKAAAAIISTAFGVSVLLFFIFLAVWVYLLRTNRTKEVDNKKEEIHAGV